MNATATAESTRPTAPAQRILQRLILPAEVSPDIVPLYIEAEEAHSRASSGSLGLRGEGGSSSRAEEETVKSTSARTRVDVNELSERYSVRIPAHSMRSFGTYFNAFPASYWRRWTPVRKIRLSVRTVGSGQLW